MFLVKLAEQDNLADTVALVMVPSLLVTFNWLGVPDGKMVLTNSANLCMRYAVMCGARMISARFADALFAWKIGSGAQLKGGRHSVRAKWKHALHTFLFTESTRKLKVFDGRTMEDLIRHEFRDWWPYLVAVTIAVTYACFGQGDAPVRFALFRNAAAASAGGEDALAAAAAMGGTAGSFGPTARP